MKVYHGYKNLSFRNPVITMGVFDGVHLGHRMLLRRVVEEAEKSGSDAVAVTFDPHPRIVLTGDPSHLRFLTDIEAGAQHFPGPSPCDRTLPILMGEALAMTMKGSATACSQRPDRKQDPTLGSW